MALLKWTSGDVITERSANNKGVRKGTEAEIAAIALVDREDGDVFWNSTNGCFQVQTNATDDERGNLKLFVGADGNVTSQTGTTPTQKKDISYIKNSLGNSGNILSIIAEMKVDAGTGYLRIRLDGSGSDSLVLSTTSASYEIQSGTIDISALATGRHTIEFFQDATTGNTVDQRDLEIYAI